MTRTPCQSNRPVKEGAPVAGVNRKLPGRLITFTLTLGTYLIFDAATINVDLRTRIAYGVLLLALVPLALDGIIKRERRGQKTPVVIILWTSWAILAALLLPFAHPTSLSSALTDLAVVASPGLFFWAYSAARATERQFMTHLVTLGIVGAVATAGAWQLSGGARFEAPSILLLSIPWIFLLIPGNIQFVHRLLGGAGALFAVGATFASRFRTSLALWIVSALFAWIMPRMNRRGAPQLFAAAIALSILVVIYSPAIVQSDQFHELAVRIRLDNILSGNDDTSLESRIREAQDVLLTMSNLNDPTIYLTGMGHGAGYEPFYSNISQNIDWESGTVHNIHITPVMVFFRYGIIGLFLFVWLVLQALRTSYQACRRNATAYNLTVFVVMAGFALDMLLRNSTASPLFSLAVALSFLQSEREINSIHRDHESHLQ